MRNPTLTEQYKKMDGSSVTLEEIISEEIQELAFIHIETTGMKPSQEKMQKWLARLRKAYFGQKLT
jgi:hypothetical protein